MAITNVGTMANVKPEDSDHSLWQGYNLQIPSSTQPPSFIPNCPPAPLNLTYHGRPQKGTYRSLDIPSIHARPYSEGRTTITASSPPTLNSHRSYPSLKRSFQSTEYPQYGEIMHDFREEMPEIPKAGINHDHRLLSFSRRPGKYTVIDSQGRIQQIELSAQIHGMFFLSEMATPGGDGTVQPELTCYRRNLFQISGSVTAPGSSLSVIDEHGERIQILAMNVSVSATESVDGHSVKLIVIPWKTPPPNSPEVGPGQEHEPAPIPMLPLDETGQDVKGDLVVYPIAYRRLQFRIATANNGRRRELQQHFVLHMNVTATLANGVKANVCETSTSPIVVRGRSPRNFQARKEIPLVGSASRGQAPDILVQTSSAPTPATIVKAKESKPPTLELPRGPFNFDASNLPPSPLMMRQP